MPWNWPDGQQLDLFGLVHVHANPLAKRENKREQVMSDTSGQKCAGLSLSANLQSSLESRLQANLAETGSPEYALTWKHWDMQSGPPICALRASVRRTSDSDCSGVLSGWPTPRARDWKSESATAEFIAMRESRSKGEPLSYEALKAGWPTPTAQDGARGVMPPRPQDTGIPLGQKVGQAFGTIASTASAAGYRLNPNFSRWLMGFPAEWASCAPTATPSSRKSRLRS